MSVTAVLALAACGSSGDESGAPDAGEGGTPSAPAVPTLQAFDPPKSFDPVRATPLPGLDVEANMAGDIRLVRQVLAGQQLLAVNDDSSVVSYDLRTGKQAWSVPMPGVSGGESKSVFAGSDGPGAPVLNERGDIAYVAIGTEIEGSGTVKDAIAIAIAAFDVETGETVWAEQIPLEGEVSVVGNPAKHPVRIQRVGDGRIVVTAGDSGPGETPQTVAVDQKTGKELWQGPWFARPISSTAALTVVEETRGNFVVTMVKLIDLKTGKLGETVAEQAGQPQVLGFVDGKAAVEIQNEDSGKPEWYHFDDRGKIVKRFGETQMGGCESAEPGVQIMLCGNESELHAIDLATMQELWAVGTKGSGREGPRHPVVYNGMVYGSVEGTGVVLDAKTGKDVTADAGAAPFLVNKYGGVAEDDGQVTFYPATS